MLQGKKIILGITGSIAAYKSAILARLFIKAGAEVQVVMTNSAKEFITPLTLSTLTNKPVLSSFWAEGSGQWNSHVELGLWADAMIIAPATANTLAKTSNGLCDTLLEAVYLSARCPVFFAPAMDLDMLAHQSTQENLEKLKQFGNHIIEPAEGELASGLVGAGRMAEPESIFETIVAFLNRSKRFAGKKILITAGPTFEAIDPVRFIGNHSSGKMGFAIAKVFAEEGAEVILVSGPSHEKIKASAITRIDVVSAEEMYKACLSQHAKVDIVVLAAAVADYKPLEPADQKIKKENSSMMLSLTKTIDIASELGKNKKSGQIHVGFALETENELENAVVKLKKKNFDMIVLNSLRDKGAGFGHETNIVTIINKNLDKNKFPVKTKSEVARDIVNSIAQIKN